MFAYNSPTPYIPELDCPIASQTRKLCLSGGVPCDGINTGSMTLQLGRVLDMILFRVPYAESTIARSCGDEIA